jgi:hypothetical protein
MTGTSMKTFPMSATSDTDIRTHPNARKNDNYRHERLTKIGTAIAMLVSLVTLTSEVYATDDDDDDKPVCYAWSIFPEERFKLNVKKQGALSGGREERNFGHPKQTAYSVHGKQIGTCDSSTEFNTMVPITGTIVVAKSNRHRGAHLGLESHAARADDSCRSITVDCTTDEDKAAPSVWTCFSRSDFGVFHGSSKLTKVDERTDERCSLFQNGSFTEDAMTREAVERPASGRRAK